MPEGLRRLAALLVAVVLVVAALIWRNNRNDDDKSAPTTTTTVPPTVICATELNSVCGAMFGEGKFKLEPAGTTAHNLETAPSPPDLWLTLDPWPTVVAERRSRANASPFDVTTTALASTRVALVGPADRLKVLSDHCTTKLLACVGDLSGQKWSTIGGLETWQLIRPAYFRPDESASGYSVFANAVVAELLKTTFSNVDLDGIVAWGRNLEAGVPTIEPTDDPTPLEQLLLGVPQYDLIGVLDTEIPRPLKPGLDVVLTGAASAVVFAMTRPGYSLPSTLAAELTKAGWTMPAETSTGLPDPNLADAVLAFWKDVKGP
jgi:hypothetical protein